MKTIIRKADKQWMEFNRGRYDLIQPSEYPVFLPDTISITHSLYPTVNWSLYDIIEVNEDLLKNIILKETAYKNNNEVKIGDKYIIPIGTKLWFINLQQLLITTKKYVIEVTHTISTDNTSFFGDLYEITFEGMEIPGLGKILYGETESNLSIVEPLGDILKPNLLTYNYDKLKNI
jgi:hypothetical protein